MVVSSCGHGTAAGRVQGFVNRRNQILALGFWRRYNFDGTKSNSHLQRTGSLHRGAERRRPGGQITPGESLGRGGEINFKGRSRVDEAQIKWRLLTSSPTIEKSRHEKLPPPRCLFACFAGPGFKPDFSGGQNF